MSEPRERISEIGIINITSDSRAIEKKTYESNEHEQAEQQQNKKKQKRKVKRSIVVDDSETKTG